jgi:membrane protein implicated in regulation of membrane protease activity
MEAAVDAATLWWIAFALLVVAELLTGTVYLLALGVGLAAGALAAHAGAGFLGQGISAAIVGAAATLAWHFSAARKRRMATGQANSSPDVQQDIGATVMVEAWAADGTAKANYRGSQWSVVALPGAARASGMHRVREVQGNRLVVEPV